MRSAHNERREIVVLLIIYSLLLISQLRGQPMSGTRTVGPTGDYPTITAALQSVGTNGLSGSLVLELQGSYVSTAETFPISMKDSTLHTAADRTITLRPAADAGDLLITAADTAVFDLNTADHIIIDGRPGGTGTTIRLTIENTRSCAPAVLLSNDACNNVIHYCRVRAADTTATTGVIAIGGTVFVSGSGNDENTIDHCIIDAQSAAIGIWSSGTNTSASVRNSGTIITNNEIVDMFASRFTNTLSAGIEIINGNSGWNISSNDLYQTIPRTYHYINTPVYGIHIAAAGDGFTVATNHIGGNSAGAFGDPWTFAGGAPVFTAIYISAGVVTASAVEGNSITNIDLTCMNSAAAGIFNGITVTNGAVDIGSTSGNVIGSGVSADAVRITTAGHALAFVPSAFGISRSAGSGDIANNIIGGITLTSSDPSFGISFTGINCGATGTGSITGNIIGSSTVENSIAFTAGATSTDAMGVHGIYSLNGTYTITGNIIAHCTILASTSAPVFNGIYVRNTTAVGRTVAQNIIRNIRTSSANISTGWGGTAFSGISFGPSLFIGTTPDFQVDRNEVYDIALLHPTAATIAYGIALNTSSKAGVVERNSVHHLSLASTSSAASVVGILANGGVTLYRNNRVQIGFDSAGNSVTGPARLFGIWKSSTTANRFFYNTVHVGGSGVTGSSPMTAAFFRSVVPAAADSVMNNIFVNERTGTAGGPHTAFVSRSASSLVMDYTILSAGSTTASFDSGATQLATIDQIRTASGGMNIHSCVASPHFVAPSGTSATFDLQLQSPTPAEGSGLALANVTDDLSGAARSTRTPADIGAYAADLLLADEFSPVITYTPLNPGRVAATRSVTGIMITDLGAGVPVSGANVPRLWFRHRDGVWSSVPGTLTSGNGNSGSWSFVMDYALIGGTPSLGDTIEYYFTAQDQNTVPLVSVFPVVGAVHPTVSAQTAPPTHPEWFVVYRELSGTVTIPGDYPSLTGTGGLFDQVKVSVLSGDLRIVIAGDLAEEGTNTFSRVYQENPGTYGITITPDAAVLREISGRSAAAILTLHGITHVTIDGRYHGEGRYLRVRNQGSGPAIRFENDAADDSLVNIIAESGTASAGVVELKSENDAVTGVDRIVMSHCVIGARTDTVPSHCRHAVASSATAALNSDIVVESCDISGFMEAGIAHTNTGNASWRIVRNDIHHGSDTGNTSTIVYGVYDRSSADSIVGNTFRNFSCQTQMTGAVFTSGPRTVIARNIVYDLVSPGWEGGFVIGGGSALIINNMVSLLTGAGQVCAVEIDGGDSIRCENNSFVAGGNATTDPNIWNAVWNPYSDPPAVFRNNIAISQRTFFAPAQKNAWTIGVYQNGQLRSDYNFFAGNANTGNDYFWSDVSMYDLDGWNAFHIGDSSSWAVNSSAIILDSLFVDAAHADLHIRTQSPFAWFFNGKGIPSFAAPADFDGDPRNAGISAGPVDIGADEFVPAALPDRIPQQKVPEKKDSSTFVSSGRAVATIVWDSVGTLPDSVALRFYPSATPPGIVTGRSSNGYWDITAYGGSGYRYTLRLPFTEALMGSITSRSHVRLGHYHDGAWAHYANASIDTIRRVVSMAGLTHFSVFALSDAQAPLPVELNSFTAVMMDGRIEVRWCTAMEIDNAGFVIQRSERNGVWQDRGSVPGAGNSSVPKEYLFVDAAGVGTLRYRLKQTDRNGTVSYSEEVTLTTVPKQYALEQNFPNPFNPSTTIRFAVPEASSVRLEVFDLLGRSAGTITEGGREAGLHQVEWKPTVASGVYYYRVECRSLLHPGVRFRDVKRMVLVR